MNEHLFAKFDQVRIINLVDRPDRRREMTEQLGLLGGMAPNMSFYEAQRPIDAGGFPSLGARGCFQSHLEVLRGARDARAKSLLILEDDLDFTRSGRSLLRTIVPDLFNAPWGMFYGAHVMPDAGRSGLVRLAAEEPVLTTSFVAFSDDIIDSVVDFLEGILTRPPGSPEFGPMHVDGAYTVFRSLNPQCATLAAFPSLGYQRSSASDVTPGDRWFDKFGGTRFIATLARRGLNLARRM